MCSLRSASCESWAARRRTRRCCVVQLLRQVLSAFTIIPESTSDGSHARTSGSNEFIVARPFRQVAADSRPRKPQTSKVMACWPKTTKLVTSKPPSNARRPSRRNKTNSPTPNRQPTKFVSRSRLLSIAGPPSPRNTFKSSQLFMRVAGRLAKA